MTEITTIKFDGVQITLCDSQGTVVDHSFAVSGIRGKQDPALQNLENIGPIPEGRYSISPREIDYRDDPAEYVMWGNGWGNARVSLHPDAGTNTYGRDKFFLHGSILGNGYGSHGCIDLNSDDMRILRMLELGGAGTIEVIVDYTENRELLATQGHPVFFEDHCFLAGTAISMWDGTKKSIEQVQPGDIVTSYDKDGTLKPGRVKRTMTNRAKQILDVHGLMVTPGHATLCGDGLFKGRHVPIIDILRSDGALVLENGSMIRAATGCPLGSLGDRMVTAIVGEDQPGGRVKIAQLDQIRLGTRFIMAGGEDVSLLDLIAEGGGIVTGDGMITTRPGGPEMPFRWTLTPTLPKPEDYVLQRSATHLHDIYQANEWEAVRPLMPVPTHGEAGPSISRHPAMVHAAPVNVPLSLRGHPDAPKMSRKYRRIAEAKGRKAQVSVH